MDQDSGHPGEEPDMPTPDPESSENSFGADSCGRSEALAGSEETAGASKADIPELDDDVVREALASVRAAVSMLKGACLWARSDQASREGVREGFEALQSLQSSWLEMVADLDSRPEAVPGARAGTTAVTFLRSKLLRNAKQATADVRAAHALNTAASAEVGGLPRLAAAFSAGRVSREHVDTVVRAIHKIPAATLAAPLPAPDEHLRKTAEGDDRNADDCGGDGGADEMTGDDPQTSEAADPERQAVPVVSAGEAADALFTEYSQTLTPAQTHQLTKHLLEALAPDGNDGFDPQAHERRRVTHSTDSTGMVIGSFQLDPVTGAWFTTAMDHFSAPDATTTEEAEDGSLTTIRDTRSGPQRRADALGEMSRRALQADEAGTSRGGEAPRIIIHTGVQDLLDLLRATGAADAHPTSTDPQDPAAEDPAAEDQDPDEEDPDEPEPEPEGCEDVEPATPGPSQPPASAYRAPNVGRTTADQAEATAQGANATDSAAETEAAADEETAAAEETATADEAATGVGTEVLGEPDEREASRGSAVENSAELSGQRAQNHARDEARPGARASSESASTTTTFQRGKPQSDIGGAGARGAQCEQLGPIGSRLLGRMVCDSLLQRVLFSASGAVLDLGREARTVTRAQRRALNARDRGCVIPGCNAPPHLCEAHHVIFWRHGGPTDIANLALVCARHHTLIHLGIWDLTMINGLPWARPPAWLDPARRRIRNTLHSGADRAHALGTQIRLTDSVDPPSAGPGGAGPGGAGPGGADPSVADSSGVVRRPQSLPKAPAPSASNRSNPQKPPEGKAQRPELHPSEPSPQPEVPELSEPTERAQPPRQTEPPPDT